MHIPPPLDATDALKQHFGADVLYSKQFRGETTIAVNPASLAEIMLFLRNTPGLVFNFLSDISAVDYYPHIPSDERPERFGVAYHLYSMLYNRRLRVKVFAAEETPVVPTIIGVFPAAGWLEREIMDMMGVKFEGNPDQRRLLMPDDWDGHPHRRDYPMGKETVQFSFNVEEILKHKPSASK
jgi:NADH-quinone oxidoreductase subunit C